MAAAGRGTTTGYYLKLRTSDACKNISALC